MKRLLLLVCISLTWSLTAQAYPNFIGYGYTTCITCHYNPYGNGMLTDYGRALGATTISAKHFYPSMDDEKLGDMSGFLLNYKQLPDWLRLAANYRGLGVFDRLESDMSTRIVHMRADASVVLQFLNSKLFFSGVIGYIPPPTGTDDALISREHYVGYRPTRELGFYLGKMDVVFGLRIPDHIAYSRQKTFLAQNDQSYGLVVHWARKEFEWGVNAFMGNILQDAVVRQKGASTMFEYDIAEKIRLGASALFSTGDVRSRWMFATHVRVGAGEGSSILSELGITHESPKSQASTTGAYYLFQSMTRLIRGLHFLVTGELYTEDAFGSAPRLLRVGPGFQYFPIQRIELRSDFQTVRNWGKETVETDTLRFMTQLSLWF